VRDARIPVCVKSTVGRAAFLYEHIQCRRHHHADISLAGKMRERRMNARTQMSKRHGRTYCDALMQQIKDRRGLSDMAETVPGDGNNEVGHFTGYTESL